jgi:hypothetical protein
MLQRERGGEKKKKKRELYEYGCCVMLALAK